MLPNLYGRPWGKQMTKGSKVKEAIRALDGQYLRGRILDVEAV